MAKPNRFTDRQMRSALAWLKKKIEREDPGPLDGPNYGESNHRIALEAIADLEHRAALAEEHQEKP